MNSHHTRIARDGGTMAHAAEENQLVILEWNPRRSGRGNFVIVLLMGTTGAGKTTVGTLLAARLGWEFVDADAFHTPANVAKMRQGIALDDADRLPWLDAVREQIALRISRKRDAVLACSALKKSYREMLCVGPDVKLVYLRGTYAEIRDRLRLRGGHFAGESLLASQFATLEEPGDALRVAVSQTPGSIVQEIVDGLGLTQ